MLQVSAFSSQNMEIKMSIQPETTNQHQLLTKPEAAEYLRTPESTLNYWRHMGKGPKSARIGSRIFYRLADLDQFINDQFNNA